MNEYITTDNLVIHVSYVCICSSAVAESGTTDFDVRDDVSGGDTTPMSLYSSVPPPPAPSSRPGSLKRLNNNCGISASNYGLVGRPVHFPATHASSSSSSRTDSAFGSPSRTRRNIITGSPLRTRQVAVARAAFLNAGDYGYQSSTYSLPRHSLDAKEAMDTDRLSSGTERAKYRPAAEEISACLAKEIPRSCLTYVERLGHGHFGEVSSRRAIRAALKRCGNH